MLKYRFSYLTALSRKLIDVFCDFKIYLKWECHQFPIKKNITTGWIKGKKPIVTINITWNKIFWAWWRKPFINIQQLESISSIYKIIDGLLQMAHLQLPVSMYHFMIMGLIQWARAFIWNILYMRKYGVMRNAKLMRHV